MGVLSLTLPADNQPNATEEPKIPTALAAIRDVINGQIDGTNNLQAGAAVANIGSGALALTKLAHGTSGQLLICNASGVVTATTVTGDGTFGPTGVFSLGTGKVTSDHVLDGTLQTGDYGNATVTSPKLSLTVYNDPLGSSGVLTTTYADAVTRTPVAGTYLLFAQWDFMATSAVDLHAEGRLRYGASFSTDPLVRAHLRADTMSPGATVSAVSTQTFDGSTQVALQARTTTGGAPNVVANSTRMLMVRIG